MTSPIKLASNKIIVLLVCLVLSFGFIYTVTAQSSGTVVDAAASATQPKVGSTLTVTVTISNVQNLFGLDAALLWNHSVLSLSNVVLNLGDSHSNGVLHGTKLNYDANNLSSGDIYVNETKLSGSYALIAQSIGHTTPSFTGSGTIVTLTFNVINTGSAGLNLTTDLADQAVVGQNANNIVHQDAASSVTAIASGSSSPPGSPTPTPNVPEFSSTILMILIATATAATVLAAKQRNKNRIPQTSLL